MSNPATTSHATNYDVNVMDDDSHAICTLAPSKETILRSTSLINELSSSLFDLTEGEILAGEQEKIYQNLIHIYVFFFNRQS